MRATISILVLTASLFAPPAQASNLVDFHCAGQDGIEAMENEWVEAGGRGPCWAHLGHHTYDSGGSHALGAVTGSIFTVEVQFSPPTEIEDGAAAVRFEGSLDGLDWTTLHTIPYALVLRAGLLPTRQGIDFSFDAGGEPVRFLRIRQPRSSAQGLSGYLDSSRFTAELDPLTPPPASGRTTERVYRCATDVMERFFDTHPCWFGGVNRYDAPSFFHTYPLGGDARIDSIAGSVTFLPWRSDDYFLGASRTAIRGFVQSSADGVRWVDLHEIQGTYGERITFEIGDLGVQARFVRLVAERHPSWATSAPLKHPRGMILDSAIAILGDVPAER